MLFDSNPWLAVLGWTVAATAVNYIIGDLFILPAVGNAAAAIADGGLGAILGWVFSLIFAGFRSTGSTLIGLAALLALIEYFFHVFLKESPKVAP